MPPTKRAAAAKSDTDDDAVAEPEAVAEDAPAGEPEGSVRAGDGEPEPEASGNAPEYTVERLLEDAYDFTGFQPHILAGAFCEEARDATFTVDQAKQRAEEFLAREVA